MSDLAAAVDFEWIGQKAASGAAQGGGHTNLDSALRFLLNNPQFLTRQVVLLYDSDTKKGSANHNNLFVRTLPQNPENTVTDKGVENLLPIEVFDEAFYSKTTRRNGPNRTTIEELNKPDLCRHLCEIVRMPAHFSNFADILDEIRTLLVTETTRAEGAPLERDATIGNVGMSLDHSAQVSEQ